MHYTVLVGGPLHVQTSLEIHVNGPRVVIAPSGSLPDVSVDPFTLWAGGAGTPT